MTDMQALRAEAAKARAASQGQTRAALPLGEPKREDIKFGSEFRAELVEKDGQEFYLVEGYASMAEKPYEMWDEFGPYNEVVSASAFDRTLAAKPMVVFRFNHSGTAMATTANGRLELSADPLGLRDRAWINPKRSDVRDLITAIEDKDVTEQSFMFMITHGEWSEDFTEFRIHEADLDRGDVGPVTYGANPFTLIASRAGEFLSAIPDMPVLAAREAMSRLAQRSDVEVPRRVDLAVDETGPPPTPAAVEALARLTPIPAPVVVAHDPGAAEALARMTPPSPVAPVSDGDGSSIRLRLAQLEVDKQHR